ncbi:hypothetical protein C7M84_006571 [Penaeus vannamei]|uniref:Uncharacterized protein n=1 Tax=Penaeus vannamei TaxID=6689 RepID=A0A423TEN4_PENVA|nr:hypothetical protein C7M84_006571 [Penaeus vannamei]
MMLDGCCGGGEGREREIGRGKERGGMASRLVFSSPMYSLFGDVRCYSVDYLVLLCLRNLMNISLLESVGRNCSARRRPASVIDLSLYCRIVKPLPSCTPPRLRFSLFFLDILSLLFRLPAALLSSSLILLCVSLRVLFLPLCFSGFFHGLLFLFFSTFLSHFLPPSFHPFVSSFFSASLLLSLPSPSLFPPPFLLLYSFHSPSLFLVSFPPILLPSCFPFLPPSRSLSLLSQPALSSSSALASSFRTLPAQFFLCSSFFLLPLSLLLSVAFLLFQRSSLPSFLPSSLSLLLVTHRLSSFLPFAYAPLSSSPSRLPLPSRLLLYSSFSSLPSPPPVSPPSSPLARSITSQGAQEPKPLFPPKAPSSFLPTRVASKPPPPPHSSFAPLLISRRAPLPPSPALSRPLSLSPALSRPLRPSPALSPSLSLTLSCPGAALPRTLYLLLACCVPGTRLLCWTYPPHPPPIPRSRKILPAQPSVTLLPELLLRALSKDGSLLLWANGLVSNASLYRRFY